MALRSIENVLGNRPIRVATRRSSQQSAAKSVAVTTQTNRLDLTDSSNSEQLDEIMRLFDTAPPKQTTTLPPRYESNRQTADRNKKTLAKNKQRRNEGKENLKSRPNDGVEEELSVAASTRLRTPSGTKRVKPAAESNRISSQVYEFNLFESDDDEKEERPRKQNKRTKLSSSSSLSKSKRYREIEDEKEIEKQLREAAQEYNEIKNYKLIVESGRHD